MTRSRIEVHLDKGNNTPPCLASKAIMESLQEEGENPVAVIVCIVGSNYIQVGFDVAAKENAPAFSAMTERVKTTVVSFIEEISK